MKKDELRKLRALNATPQMIQKAKEINTRTRKRRNWNTWQYEEYTVKEPKYAQLIRVQNLKGYVKVAVFFPDWLNKGIKTPRYEIFINVPGHEWITRELKEDGTEFCWRGAMVSNLDNVYLGYYWDVQNYPETTYANQDARRTLSRLDCKNNKLSKLRRLNAWQQAALDKKTELKEKKEQEPWDRDMKLVSKEPNSFKEWLRKETLEEYYIIYEYAKKGQTEGFCTRCRRIVPISRPKHRVSTKCPACKGSALYISKGKQKNLRTNGEGTLIQSIKDGIVIRVYRCRLDIATKNINNPNLFIHEYERILKFNDGSSKRYLYESYKMKYERWCCDKDYTWGQSWWGRTGKSYVYKRNLHHVISKTDILRNSTFMLWEQLPVALDLYLSMEKKHPAIEKLIKVDMYKLAEHIIDGDNINIDESQSELHKILRIDKARLRRLRTMESRYALSWLQNEKLADTIWPDEMIKEYSDARISLSSLSFLNTPVSPVKCCNYLKKQAVLSGKDMRWTLETWRDYINMAEQLKMNTSLSQINRPKNLKAAHDECILLREAESMEKQAKQIEKKWKKVNSQLPKLKKFEYKNGDYQIIAPAKVVDIVKEGTILKHCVHTCDYYFDRIQRDESYLFFLRHSDRPDMPWYTLEVEPSGNIRQKRTTGDNQNADFQEAVAFLKKWQKFFQKQLTKEEKKLGDKANKARLKNYEELRKNGNKVWHGKLAGQLLADVLEADFMEVSENVG